MNIHDTIVYVVRGNSSWWSTSTGPHAFINPRNKFGEMTKCYIQSTLDRTAGKT